MVIDKTNLPPVDSSQIYLIFISAGLVLQGLAVAEIAPQRSWNELLRFTGLSFVAIGVVLGVGIFEKEIGRAAESLVLAGFLLRYGSITMSNFGSIGWSQFAVALHGVSFMCASLALVSMISHRNSVERAALNELDSEDSRTAAESVRVPVASLVIGAIGFAMLGVSYLATLPFENGGLHETVLTKVARLGWLLLAVAIVTERTRLGARFGPRAAIFGVIAAAFLGLYPLVRFFVADMSLGDARAYENYEVFLAIGYVSAGLAFGFLALHKRDEQGSAPGHSQED